MNPELLRWLIQYLPLPRGEDRSFSEAAMRRVGDIYSQLDPEAQQRAFGETPRPPMPLGAHVKTRSMRPDPITGDTGVRIHYPNPWTHRVEEGASRGPQDIVDAIEPGPRGGAAFRVREILRLLEEIQRPRGDPDAAWW